MVDVLVSNGKGVANDDHRELGDGLKAALHKSGHLLITPAARKAALAAQLKYRGDQYKKMSAPEVGKLLGARWQVRAELRKRDGVYRVVLKRFDLAKINRCNKLVGVQLGLMNIVKTGKPSMFPFFRRVRIF